MGGSTSNDRTLGQLATKVVSNEVKSYYLDMDNPQYIQKPQKKPFGDQEVISDRPTNHLPPEFRNTQSRTEI